MRVGLEDALLLFRKWIDEHTRLQCNISLTTLSASFRGTVLRADREGAAFISPDLTSELSLAFNSATHIRYGDSRETEDVAEFDGVIAVIIREAEDGSEFVSFSELRD